MTSRVLRLAGILLLAEVASISVRAQETPAAVHEDLTVPPEMRNGTSQPEVARIAPAARPGLHRTPQRRGDRGDDKAARAATADNHPVELGVTMRGGSGTPRVYAPTGTSQAIQEGGSAFGAAMKFGF